MKRIIGILVLTASAFAFAQNNGEGGRQTIQTPPEPVKVETSTTTRESPVGQPTTDYHPSAAPTLKVNEPPPPGR
jgi:hypothetical protein